MEGGFWRCYGGGEEIRVWLLPWPPNKPRRVFAKAERAVGSPMTVQWMPDSQHFIFSAGEMLVVADIRSERYWPITVQDRPMLSPTPSPDGKRVAYQSSLSHSDVIAVPLGEGPIQTVLGSAAYEGMPACSPVAPQIVYRTDKNPPGIWLKSMAEGWDRPLVETRNVRVAGEAARILFNPVFSGDGRRILFGAVSPGGSAFFTIPISGGPHVLAAKYALGGMSFTWSPDGKWLAFRRREQKSLRLVKVRAGSEEPAVDLAATGGPNMPEWSPSGEWIAFPDGTRDGNVSLISPDGKETRPLCCAGTVAWSRDGKKLYLVDPRKHALTAIDIATGKERILRQVGDLLPYSGPQPGLRASVTADGKSIVYAVLRPREEIWILEDVRIREPWYAWLLSLVHR
jgi:Tol biopolymer transport system component